MKLSFMTFSTPELTLNEVLEVAKKYGYVGVELRISANHAHGVETTMSLDEIRKAKNIIDKSGIEIVAIATSCVFANELTFDKNLEDAKAAIKLASAFNVPVIRTFGGKYPDDTSKNKARSLLKNAYSQLAPIAEEYKVYVCFETHDMWCSPYDVAEILTYVNSEYIKVNWDLMHPITHGFTMEESFNILKPFIKHVHLHDGKGILNNKSLGLITTGQGSIDHKQAFDYLRSINYKGALSGEWISWDHYTKHLPREIKILKTLI